MLKTGAIVLVLGILVNALFMKLEVGGILRELSRLSVLIGLLLTIFGAIAALFKKK